MEQGSYGLAPECHDRMNLRTSSGIRADVGVTTLEGTCPGVLKQKTPGGPGVA